MTLSYSTKYSMPCIVVEKDDSKELVIKICLQERAYVEKGREKKFCVSTKSWFPALSTEHELEYLIQDVAQSQKGG